MRFFLFDFAGKGTWFAQRLVAAGHEHTEFVQDADVVLLDCDWEWAHPRPQIIQEAAGAGAKVVLYPHAGMPTTFVYDGLTAENPDVSLRLEHGIGSVEMAQSFGGDLRQEAVGWLFSPTAFFAPVDDPRKVLFCPLHPNIEAMNKGISGNGHDPAPAINQRIYRELLGLGLELTVSVVGPPHRSGIWPHPKATFVQNDAMVFPNSYALIQEADVVVAAGTLLAASVASGKPTVGFGPNDCGDYIGGAYKYATHAADYKTMADFPLDCTYEDVAILIAAACGEDADVDAWRKRWVGDDGTEKAIAAISRLVPEIESLPGQTNREDDLKKKHKVPPTVTTLSKDPTVKHVTITGVTAKAGAKAKTE